MRYNFSLYFTDDLQWVSLLVNGLELVVVVVVVAVLCWVAKSSFGNNDISWAA